MVQQLRFFVGLICGYASFSIASTPETCIAFESSYHVDKGCRCVVYESNDHREGTFQSIGYPLPYPQSINCILYTFVGDRDELVQLSFKRFDLHQPASESSLPFPSFRSSTAPSIFGCVDYLRIYLDLERPELNGQQRPNYELCGNLTASDPLLITKKLFSLKRSIILEFHSGPIQRPNSGFYGTYQFLNRTKFEMPVITTPRRTLGVQGNTRWSYAASAAGSTIYPRKAIGSGSYSSALTGRGNASMCVYDFRSSPTTKSGSFYSPGYPQSYPHGIDCLYRFQSADSNERVSVMFSSVQLGLDTGLGLSAESALQQFDLDCADSITVFDGNDTTTAPVIARFCSSANQTQRFPNLSRATSRNNQLTVLFISRLRQQQFNTDAVTSSKSAWSNDITYTRLVSRQSFEATFEFILDKIAAFDPSTSPVVDGPFADEQHGIMNYRIKNETYRTSCSAEYHSNQSSAGVVYSPLHPALYPANVVCIYTITGRINERVQLAFNSFSLNYPQGDPRDPFGCDDVDHVDVNMGAGELIRHCGAKRPPLMMSARNCMQVTFCSNPASSAFGFEATFVFVTDFGIKNGRQTSETECRFVYRSDISSNGSFTSPNFPGLYPRNTTCLYELLGRPNERVVITFAYFKVEGIQPRCHENELSDYVLISPAHDGQGRRFCGSWEMHDRRPIPTDVGQPSSLYVTFRSNDVHDETGFEAHYHFRRHASDDDQTTNRKRIRSSSGHKFQHIFPPLTTVGTVVTMLFFLSGSITSHFRAALNRR